MGIELVSMLDRYMLGLAHAAIICCNGNVNVQWLYVFTLRGYNSINSFPGIPILYLASYMVHNIATTHIYETFSAAMKSQEAALSIGVVHQ